MRAAPKTLAGIHFLKCGKKEVYARRRPPAAHRNRQPAPGFTREEFEQILDTPAFSGQRFELIDGDMIDKNGAKSSACKLYPSADRLLAEISGLERVQIKLPVEVAETSLSRDTTIKRDLYARAGVPEYWVLDLESRRVVVHRAPDEGQYSQISELKDNESLAFESHSIPVAQLLP